MLKAKIAVVVSGLIFLMAVIGSVFIGFIFRNPTQIFPHQPLFASSLLIILFFIGLFFLPNEKDVFSGILSVAAGILIAVSAFLAIPFTGNLLVVVPERGGIREAYVIETIGFLRHPFSDKLIAIRSSYAVEMDIAVNTDDGRKFIARSHKKEFRVIDPIAVYHRIGWKKEIVEEHLRDGIKRCFHQEMTGRQFSDMLVKKTGESFFIQSHVCELGLKFYGLEPVGGKQISFADYRIADVPPIQLKIE
ncbi:MAG: hypothetical protein HYT28_02760 [Parcubacteria group bacterium]|nr:hypothetical protein [Parcubacteria group bacterium]